MPAILPAAGALAIGGLIGEIDDEEIVFRSNHTTNVTLRGSNGTNSIGGVVGISDAPIFSSYAVNAALTGGSGQDNDWRHRRANRSKYSCQSCYQYRCSN